MTQPEGQAFLWKVAESLVQLRRTKKRWRFQGPAFAAGKCSG
jgi:hypothetical protein